MDHAAVDCSGVGPSQNTCLCGPYSQHIAFGAHQKSDEAAHPQAAYIPRQKGLWSKGTLMQLVLFVEEVLHIFSLMPALAMPASFVVMPVSILLFAFPSLVGGCHPFGNPNSETGICLLH